LVGRRSVFGCRSSAAKTEPLDACTNQRGGRTGNLGSSCIRAETRRHPLFAVPFTSHKLPLPQARALCVCVNSVEWRVPRGRRPTVILGCAACAARLVLVILRHFPRRFCSLAHTNGTGSPIVPLWHLLP
jgi:hypothetical protein